ncbi:MAG: ribbon-helix-helix protein, CopG family [Alphaproteobacteria bacterium]
MSVTLTVRVSEELLAKLDKLAEATDRSKSYLAAEAIESYVAHELPIVEKILEGLKSVREGRTIPHAEAMAHVRRTIERVAAEQTAKRKSKQSERA